jgi:hypothetical protein
MDTELLQALGAEVAEELAALRAEVRRDLSEALAAVRRESDEACAVLRARVVEAEHRAERAEADLAALREVIADPVVAFSRDADGGVRLIQRHGPERALPLPDMGALVRAAVDALRDELRAEAQAMVARTFELFCNAPAWSETAVYTAGDIVQTDVGRTYRVRASVKATLGRVPGDDAEHWERLGTAGFRVLKSRPAELAPGDMFTEHDARFLHDGRATVLFVPKAAKTSDLERAARASHTLVQATQSDLREQAARLGEMLADVQRTTRAANDASETSVQALAAIERMQGEVESLTRRVDELTAAVGGGR